MDKYKRASHANKYSSNSILTGGSQGTSSHPSLLLLKQSLQKQPPSPLSPFSFLGKRDSQETSQILRLKKIEPSSADDFTSKVGAYETSSRSVEASDLHSYIHARKRHSSNRSSSSKLVRAARRAIRLARKKKKVEAERNKSEVKIRPKPKDPAKSDLGVFVSDLSAGLPIFGYPLLCFSPKERVDDYWGLIASSITNEYTEHVVVKEILSKVHQIDQNYQRGERRFVTGQKEEANPSLLQLPRSSVVSSRLQSQHNRGQSCFSVSPDRAHEASSTFHQIEQRRHTLKKPDWKNSFSLSPERKNRTPPSSTNLIKYRDAVEPQTLKIERESSPQTTLLKQFEHGSTLAINSIPLHQYGMAPDILSNIKEVDSSMNFKDSQLQRDNRKEQPDSSPFCCLEELNLLTARKVDPNGILKSGRQVFQLQGQKDEPASGQQDQIPFLQREKQAAQRRKMRNYILSKASTPLKLSAQQRLAQFKKNAKIKAEGILNPVLSFKKNNAPPSFSTVETGALTDRVRTDFKNESGLHSEITWDNKPLQLSKMVSMSSMKSTRVDTDCYSASSRNRFISRPQSSNSYRRSGKKPARYSEIIQKTNETSTFKENSANSIQRAVGKSKSVCKLKPYIEQAMKPIRLPSLASQGDRSKGYETERPHYRQPSILSTFHNFNSKALPQLLPRKKERLFSRRQALDTLDAKM